MNQIDQINEVLDALGNDATVDELEYATRGYAKRDVAVVFAKRALAAGQAIGSVANPVSESVWDIVATAEQPIGLFITGPPVGSGEDHLVGIATGEPDYDPLVLIYPTGEVRITPQVAGSPGLTIVSSDSDDSIVLQVDGAAGQVLHLKANGQFRLLQPGVDVVLEVNSDGSIKVGRFGGELGFYGAEPVARPELPASPDAQDVVDAGIALGLFTQAS